ncbi:hypothetical protein BGZ58_003978, partial [Dissophora ornata]
RYRKYWQGISNNNEPCASINIYGPAYKHHGSSASIDFNGIFNNNQSRFKFYFGKKVEIPMEPINLETNGDRLYQLSIYHLRKAKMTPITTTLERSRNIDYKDAFVSLSAIWNIFSENANNMFGAEKTKEVLRLLKVQEDINHPELLEITPLLLRPGSTGEELLEIS